MLGSSCFPPFLKLKAFQIRQLASDTESFRQTLYLKNSKKEELEEAHVSPITAYYSIARTSLKHSQVGIRRFNQHAMKKQKLTTQIKPIINIQLVDTVANEF